MALPFDQLLRRERFIKEHPAWSICPQDGGVRFTAEKTEGKNSHVIAGQEIHAPLRGAPVGNETGSPAGRCLAEGCRRFG